MSIKKTNRFKTLISLLVVGLYLVFACDYVIFCSKDDAPKPTQSSLAGKVSVKLNGAGKSNSKLPFSSKFPSRPRIIFNDKPVNLFLSTFTAVYLFFASFFADYIPFVFSVCKFQRPISGRLFLFTGCLRI